MADKSQKEAIDALQSAVSKDQVIRGGSMF
jgi:hypothetical protein